VAAKARNSAVPKETAKSISSSVKPLFEELLPFNLIRLLGPPHAFMQI
jgi:hypothetical protein